MIQSIPIIIIFINLFLSFFVLSQNRKSLNNQLFSLLAFLAAFWTFANYMLGISVSIFWLQTAYALGALVLYSGLMWILVMTQSRLNKIFKFLILIITLCLVVGSYKTGFLINHVDDISNPIFTGAAGWGLTLYSIYYFGIAILILFNLFRFYKETSDAKTRVRIINISIGAFISLIATAFNSFILPHFSIFLFGTIGTIDNLGFLIFLIIIGYSISKHNLFNIKVITIELATFALWVVILIRMLTASSMEEIVVEAGMLAVSLILGILLIRSVLQEITQREKIDRLSADLQTAYEHIKTISTSTKSLQ